MGKKRKPTITQSIMNDVRIMCKQNFENSNTQKQYYRDFKRFLTFTRSKNPDIKSLNDLVGRKDLIQSYADYLVEQGYSGFSVHTFLSSPCRLLGVSLSEINKPQRRIAEMTRGRRPCKDCTASDLENVKWSYIVEFEKRIGLRRSELARITGKSLIKEYGNYYISVRSKGGLIQKQLVSPEDVEFIKPYFDRVGKNERVFGKEWFNNNLNFHKLRAEHAYSHYLKLCEKVKQNPDYEKVLLQEIERRWFERKKKPIPKKLISGTYTLRGQNRELAKKLKKPLSYSNICTMHTSLFKLAHFRNDVTINHYYLT